MDPMRWFVRGFQGVVQALEEATREGVAMDQTTLDNLRHWVERLAKVGEAQSKLAEPQKSGRPK